MFQENACLSGAFDTLHPTCGLVATRDLFGSWISQRPFLFWVVGDVCALRDLFAPSVPMLSSLPGQQVNEGYWNVSDIDALIVKGDFNGCMKTAP